MENTDDAVKADLPGRAQESEEIPAFANDGENGADDSLLLVAERLAGVEQRLADFHRRSEHRESIIDKLHDENQILRSGLRKTILDPVVIDLFRLYDSLQKEGVRLGAEPSGKLFTSFADDAELILERCGMESFTPRPGDLFDPSLHTPVGTVLTDDADQHNTVETVLSAGFVEQENGRVRRPARARFWKHDRRDVPRESE